MYSMVLMAALTTGVDTPDFGRRGGCCGCYGGYGGCYGGCYGGGWARGWGGWGGGYGGWGGWGGWGYGGYAYAPAIATYAAPVMAANLLPTTTDVTRSMYYKPYTAASNRATVIVHLPTNAKLVVDGKLTRSTSNTRRFVSPPLEAGKGYHYDFVAKVERDGKVISIPQRVDVRAGQKREIP